MKKFDKVVLTFIALIGFSFSVCILSIFYPVPYVQDVVKQFQADFLFVDYVFAGYSVAMCLCFFILLLIALLLPTRADFLILPKEKGKLYFSRKTVESTVRYSFSDIKEINFSKIKVKINKVPDKTKVYVRLSLNDTRQLAPLTEEVQTKISSALQSSLNITVKSITVRVTEFNTNPSDKKEINKDVSEEIRVI